MKVINEPEYRLLRKIEVCTLLGDLPKSTLERLIQRGVFPKPYHVFHKIVLWKSNEVEDFLNSRKHHQPRYRPTKKDELEAMKEFELEEVLEEFEDLVPKKKGPLSEKEWRKRVEKKRANEWG